MLRFVFGFKGRVNRAKFWIFYLAVCVIGGAMGAAAISITRIAEATKSIDTQPLVLPWPLSWNWSPLDIAMTALTVLLFWSVLAMVVKRLHDRNKSAWWLLLFYGLPIACFAAAYFLGWPPRNEFPGQQIVMFVAFAISWLTTMWYLIEILFLPGTRGDNRFGPDPIAKHHRG